MREIKRIEADLSQAELDLEELEARALNKLTQRDALAREPSIAQLQLEEVTA